MARSAVGASPQSAYQRALGRLARRDHSVAELRRALVARGHEEDEVEAVLERLRRERYLDDAGYAERFARSRLAHHGHESQVDRGRPARACQRALHEVRLELRLGLRTKAQLLDLEAGLGVDRAGIGKPARLLPRGHDEWRSEDEWEARTVAHASQSDMWRGAHSRRYPNGARAGDANASGERARAGQFTRRTKARRMSRK